MTIMITLGVILIISLFLISTDMFEVVGVVGTIASGLCLVLAIIMFPLNHMAVQSQIHEFVSVQQTIQDAREDDREIESAAFQLKVAEMNQWLANTQYWNTTMFKDWFPNEIDHLKPIKQESQ